MRVIIFSEDLSGRRDDGYYSKSDIKSALDLFFSPEDNEYYSDRDQDNPITRTEIEELFTQDNRVTFFNNYGEKIVISLDTTVHP